LSHLEKFNGPGSLGRLPQQAQAEMADTPNVAQLLSDADPLVAEMLAHLELLIEQAILGDHGALAQIEVVWPLVLSELSDEVALECQTHYVRQVLSVWDSADPQSNRVPAHAVAALDVLCQLLEATDEATLAEA